SAPRARSLNRLASSARALSHGHPRTVVRNLDAPGGRLEARLALFRNAEARDLVEVRDGDRPDLRRHELRERTRQAEEVAAIHDRERELRRELLGVRGAE